MFLNNYSAESKALPITAMAEGFVKFLDNNTGDAKDNKTDHYVLNERGIFNNNRHYSYDSLMLGWPNGNAPTEATIMVVLGFLHLYIGSNYERKDWLERAEKYWDAYVETFYGGVPIPDTPTYWPDHWVVNGKAPVLACYPINWSVPYSSGWLDAEVEYKNGIGVLGDKYKGKYLTYAYMAYKGVLQYECVKAEVQRIKENGEVDWSEVGNGEKYMVDWIVNEDHKKLQFNGNWGGVSADIIDENPPEPCGTIKLVDTTINGVYKTTCACKPPVEEGGYLIKTNEQYITWPLQVPCNSGSLQPASDASEWFLDASRILYTLTKKDKYLKAYNSELLTLKEMCDIDKGQKFFRKVKGNFGFKTDGLAITYAWGENGDEINPTFSRSTGGYILGFGHDHGKIWLDNKGTFVQLLKTGTLEADVGVSSTQNMRIRFALKSSEQSPVKYTYEVKGANLGSFELSQADKVVDSNVVHLSLPVNGFKNIPLHCSKNSLPEVIYDTNVNDDAPAGAYTNFSTYYPEETENRAKYGQTTVSYAEEDNINYGAWKDRGGVTTFNFHGDNTGTSGCLIGFWHTYDNADKSGSINIRVIPSNMIYRSDVPLRAKISDANGTEWESTFTIPPTNGKWARWDLPVEQGNWRGGTSIVWPTGVEFIQFFPDSNSRMPTSGGVFSWACVNVPSGDSVKIFQGGAIKYLSIMIENLTDSSWAFALGDVYCTGTTKRLTYTPGTLPYGNNNQADIPTIEAWRGCPYTGYQYPVIYNFSNYEDASEYLNNMMDFLYDAQQEYSRRFGLLGPVMQSYYWERWDSVEKGVADTFTNETFDNSWSGYEPRAFFGPMRCLYLFSLQKKTPPQKLVTYCQNWLDFLSNHYAMHGFLPDLFMEAGGVTKQSYDDFPIICLYGAGLCYAAMMHMSVSKNNLDALISWCNQYMREKYLVVAGSPTHPLNGGVSQSPDLEGTNGEFYGYQAGEILRFWGIYLQYLRGIKENIIFSSSGLPDTPTPPTPEEPDEPTEPDTGEIKTLDALKSKIHVPEVDIGTAWTKYKNKWFNSEGYIRDESQNAAHSESTGYGLMFEVASGDKASFNKTLTWADTHLLNSETGLYCWRYLIGETDHVPDKNNATDGDILIAWALIKAARVWEDLTYLNRAKQIINAIKLKCTKEFGGYTLLLPGWTGFDHSDVEDDKSVTINPCYYIYGALKDFAIVTGDSIWTTIILDGESLTSNFIVAMNPAEKILPDWFTVKEDGTFGWSQYHNRQSGWDAIRCPLYAYWYNSTHPWVTLWKAWYEKYNNDVSKLPARVDIATSGVADAMYSTYTGFKAVFNLVKNDRATTNVSEVSYYLDSLEFLCWLALNHY